MGVGSSTANKLDKALATDLPEDERYFGLENFGNTCYCNSVLQALYFCEPFRKQVLLYDRDRRERIRHNAEQQKILNGNGSHAASGLKSAVKGVGNVINVAGNQQGSGGGSPGSASTAANGLGPGNEETLLSALGDLFTQITNQKKRTGSVPPKTFVNRLRQENELFRSYMHQDAHEFLNYVLNNVVENLNKEEELKKKDTKGLPPEATNGVSSHSASSGTTIEGDDPKLEKKVPKTFVHDLFEGHLSNETRCLCCETVTQRVEPFLDVSVDIAQNSSLTSCLRNFSSTELLNKEDKFYCDACCSYQEAEKRMKIKKLPRILALHLKRFKYVEHINKYKKLSYRVVFPLEYRLCNTSDDIEDPDRCYSLFAVVVHVGSGPNHGHYVVLIKSHGQWLLFDDDCVEPKDESELQSVFGCTQETSTSTESGYILFYESS
ncbi:hypothetical protein NDN08_007463 [Rhodosorus marinus]|uniref:Ubiquitin carboxyl-terminal hydrolase n=1 Tax=Rhodosorus marinus TaxID=101924 RepID=A0AAV8UXX3_9RHOD|nr:hypothetical protein NDN08_007463 [Rhodosorus marinus]